MDQTRAALRPQVRRNRPLDSGVSMAKPGFMLSDYTIIALSKNAGLVSQFPFLGMQKKLTKRRCCGKAERVDKRIVMAEANRIRSHVLNMPQQEFVRFKQALGQPSVTLVFPNGSTKTRT